MGETVVHPPVLPLLVAFSRHDLALVWARRRAEEAWGPVVLASPVYDFAETDYYDAAMGRDLRLVMLAFERLFDPAELAERKLQTNRWEDEYAAAAGHAEPRPLNLDPGYLTLAKLVLASTKDHSHRIYLGQGVFAEVTLNYQHHVWKPRDWTYPNYRRTDYQAFLSECREYYKQRRDLSGEVRRPIVG